MSASSPSAPRLCRYLVLFLLLLGSSSTGKEINSTSTSIRAEKNKLVDDVEEASERVRDVAVRQVTHPDVHPQQNLDVEEEATSSKYDSVASVDHAGHLDRTTTSVYEAETTTTQDASSRYESAPTVDPGSPFEPSVTVDRRIGHFESATVDPVSHVESATSTSVYEAEATTLNDTDVASDGSGNSTDEQVSEQFDPHHTRLVHETAEITTYSYDTTSPEDEYSDYYSQYDYSSEPTPSLDTTTTMHTMYSVHYTDRIEPTSTVVSGETVSVHRESYDEHGQHDYEVVPTVRTSSVHPDLSEDHDYPGDHSGEYPPPEGGSSWYTYTYTYEPFSSDGTRYGGSYSYSYSYRYDFPSYGVPHHWDDPYSYPDYTLGTDYVSGMYSDIDPTSVTYRYGEPTSDLTRSTWAYWLKSKTELGPSLMVEVGSHEPTISTLESNRSSSTTTQVLPVDETSGSTGNEVIEETSSMTDKPSVVGTTEEEEERNQNDTKGSTEKPNSVRVYVQVELESTWPEFCENRGAFQEAVAQMLRKNLERPVKWWQVVLLDMDQCDGPIHKRAAVITVNFYVRNSEGKYDPELTEAVGTTWHSSRMEDTQFNNKIKKLQMIYPHQSAVTDKDSTDSNNSGIIAAITISTIAAVCLLLVGVLLVMLKQRHARAKYVRRCRPAALNAYNLDSMSVTGSLKRKHPFTASKRSYINQGFEDPNAPSHPVNFAGLANFCLEEGTLEEEFKSIPSNTPTIDDLPAGAEEKNRYANVIPVPETRVILKAQNGDPLSDYINANFVKGPKGAPKYYIASQGPLESTRADFWRMVWEQQSRIIVMLTDFVEDDVQKCAEYFPVSETLDCHQLYGDFQVTLKRRESKESYVVSHYVLKEMEQNLRRDLTHFWFHAWPIRGVPDDPAPMAQFLLDLRPYCRSDGNQHAGPVVVHCSPGTGRTGTFIACDIGMREFDHDRLVDIPKCVHRIRRDRAGAVQTKEQYVFIYKVLNYYAAKLTGAAMESL